MTVASADIGAGMGASAEQTLISSSVSVAVEKLSTAPAVVQCPSCDQIITTETLRKVGGTARLLCVMCSLLGCVHSPSTHKGHMSLGEGPDLLLLQAVAVL